MATDFSISGPTFEQFDFNGWPDDDKTHFINRVRALHGVTDVKRAGGNSSIHVHFDSKVVNRDAAISAVKAIAGPIMARLRGHVATDHLEAQALTTGSATTASSPDLVSRAVIRSSGWTGNKSVPEQITTIRAYAPLALAGLDSLAAAIEKKRYNDEETQHALEILKELRTAIDELIHAAESGQPLSALWQSVERNSHALIEAAKTGAKVFVAAPILGLGAAYAISLVTGDPMTGQMAATLTGGSLVAGAMTSKDKK